MRHLLTVLEIPTFFAYCGLLNPVRVVSLLGSPMANHRLAVSLNAVAVYQVYSKRYAGFNERPMKYEVLRTKYEIRSIR